MDELNFKLHPWQAEALVEFLEKRTVPYPSVSRARELEAAWQGIDDVASYVQYIGRAARPKTMFTPEIMKARRAQQDAASRMIPIIWDEAHTLDELPFTGREETPHCRSVRVCDLKGYSPAVELCNRHPSLLVAADWRSATTFDLYAMAVKTSKSWIADMTIDDIVGVKRWVEFMDDVQHLLFDDVTAPAQLYTNAVFHDNVKSLFKAGFGLDYLRLTLVRYLYPMTKDDTHATT